MAVENTTLIIMITIFFNYFIVYKKNKFFGNIMFILSGVSILYFGSSFSGADKNISILMGVIIFVGSVINFIYDTFYSSSVKTASI